jgi:hypothetical protein
MSADTLTKFLGHHRTTTELKDLENKVKPMLVSHSIAPNNMYFKFNHNYIRSLISDTSSLLNNIPNPNKLELNSYI